VSILTKTYDIRHFLICFSNDWHTLLHHKDEFVRINKTGNVRIT